MATFRIFLMAGVSFACLTQAGTSSTYAQEENDSFILEEIVVSARKRAEKAQDVPIAISTFSSATIERLNITKTDDLAMYTPNLHYTPGFSGSSTGGGFFIRGVGQNDFLATNDPGVAVYIDGVYLSRTLGSTLNLSDIERVEVLKGPQGTLFGKNATGGAINITTKAPGDEFAGEAKVTVGNYNRVDASGYASLPISDTLSSMVSFSTTNVDGFSERVLDGVRLGGDDNIVARTKLRWRASDAWQVNLSADVTRRRSVIAAFSATALPLGHPETVSSDPRKISTTSVRPSDNLDVYGFSATVSGDLSDTMQLKSITAYRDLAVSTAGDFDGTLAIINEQQVEQASKQFSQELQLTGALADGSVAYVFGAFYLNEKTDQSVTSQYVFDPAPEVTRSTDLETDSYALFSHVTWDLSDRLTVEGGLRYSYEKRDITFGSTAGILDSLGTVGAFTESDSASYENLVPKFSLRYRVTDDAIAYVSYSQGFKSGNYPGRPTSPGELLPYDEETVTTYELGMKADWLDHRLRTNFATYFSQYKDIQQFLIGVNEKTGFLIFGFGNAGDADVWGGEFELQYAMTPALTLFGSVGYTDNEYKRVGAGATTALEDRLPFQSKWSLAGGFDYAFQMASDAEIVFGGDLSYRSSYDHTTDNDLSVLEDGYLLLNLRASYEPASENWKLTLWGRNIGDTEYITASQNLLPFAAEAVAWFGRPAEYGATVSFRF